MTAKAPKQSSLTIRLDTELSERFKQVSKDNDRNQSQLIREWITSSPPR